MAYVTTFDIERDRKVIDVTKRIKEERPELSTFMVLLMRARKRTTVNTILHWWDDKPWAWWTKYTGSDENQNPTAGAVITLDVEDSSIFRPKDTLIVPRTGEQMLVTEIVSSTSIKAVRLYFEGAKTGTEYRLKKDDAIMWLANAMEQFSNAPESKIAQPTKRYNYTQTVRTPFDESMQSATDDIITSEKERQRLRRKKMFDHRLSLERTAIWGRRHEDSSGKRHLTAGINQFITTEFKFADYVNGGVGFEDIFFTDFTDAAFAYGESGDKLLLTSPLVLVQINKFAHDQIQTSSGDETYGLKLRYVQTALGRLFLVPSRTFANAFAKTGFVLDMENIWYRPKQTRDTKLKTNIQENDADGWRDEYLTEFAMQVELDKNHVRVDFDLEGSGGGGGDDDDGGDDDTV